MGGLRHSGSTGRRSWLLGLAVAAAVARWALVALTPEIVFAAWTDPAARALDLAAGLWWVARYEPLPGEAFLTWDGVLVSATRAAAVVLAGFAGTALLAVAAADPHRSREASPRASAARARPNWGE